MLKRLIVFTVLLTASALAWVAEQVYTIPWMHNVFLTLAAITALYAVLKLVFEEWLGKRIHNEKTQYMFRKSISVLFLTTAVIAVIRVWVQDPQSLLVAYGLLGAGVAIALQDFFKNFAGGITLFTTGKYRVGDRVQIGDMYGDVIDIGLMYTTVMEIQEWVNGDQATGRMVNVPNGHVLGTAFHNYTENNSFIWDEITLTLTYESNWEKALDALEAIAEEETQDIRKQAEKEIRHIKEKYYLTERNVEPQVFLGVTDNWVELHLRYVTAARNRRDLHNRISRRVLELVEESDDLEIGSETSDVTIRDRS